MENNSKRYYTLGQLSLSNEAVIQATVQQHTITQSLQTRKEFCRRWFSSATAATNRRHDLHDTLSKRFQRRDIGYTSCAWLLEKQEFKETLGGASSSVLWLKGRPGAGKSVLASVVVDYLSKRAADNSYYLLLYYFCRQRCPQTTLNDIVCWLLAQMKQGGDERVVDGAEKFVCAQE